MPRSPELTPEETVQVVVLVLENHQGEVLLTQRHSNKHLAYYWEFPGGKVENHETHIEALARECIEELNYTIVNPTKIMCIPFNYPEIRVHLHVYFERNNHSSIRPVEEQNMQWVTKQALTEVQLPPANQAIIDYLQSK